MRKRLILYLISGVLTVILLSCERDSDYENWTFQLDFKEALNFQKSLGSFEAQYYGPDNTIMTTILDQTNKELELEPTRLPQGIVNYHGVMVTLYADNDVVVTYIIKTVSAGHEKYVVARAFYKSASEISGIVELWGMNMDEPQLFEGELIIDDLSFELDKDKKMIRTNCYIDNSSFEKAGGNLNSSK